LRPGAGPTSFRFFDQRESVRMSPVSVVNTSQRSQIFFEVDYAEFQRRAQSCVQCESFKEPVVVAFQLQRVWHPEMEDFMREDDCELRFPALDCSVGID